MAKVQSRRTISLNRAVFSKIQEAADKAGFGCSEYVTRILREYVPGLPFTEHAQVSTKCECGRSKAKTVEACDRCSYLDGAGTGMPLGEIISTLRGSDGMSLRELCAELAMNMDERNGVRQMWRWIKVLLEQGRIRRYWREDSSTEVTRMRGFGGCEVKRHQSIGCWVYALDGKTESEWKAA